MSTVPNPGAFSTAPVDTAPQLRHPGRRAAILAGVVATVGLATLGSWLGSKGSAPSEPAARTQLLTTFPTVSLEQLEIERAEKQLARGPGT